MLDKCNCSNSSHHKTKNIINLNLFGLFHNEYFHIFHIQ